MSSKALPLVQTDDRNTNQLQQNIAQAINPLIKNPVNSGIILQRITLGVGKNVIPTNLNRKLQGWVTVRVRAPSTIYDNQDSNPTPAFNLILYSSAQTVVDLYVF